MVKFPAGFTYEYFSLEIVDDGLPEGAETVILGITNLPPGLTLRGLSSAQITILNLSPSLRVSRDPEWLPVSESAGVATLPLLRRGDTNVAFRIDYATTTRGTAVAGADYVPQAGSIDFAPGEREKSIRIALLNNGVPNPGEMLSVVFEMTVVPPGAATVESPEPLYIRDAQTPTSLDLSFRPQISGVIARGADGRLLVGNNTGIAWLTDDGSVQKRVAVSFDNGDSSGLVSLLAVQLGGKIFVGGFFTHVQGLPRGGLVRLHPSGVVDPAFQPAPLGIIRAWLVKDDGRVLANTDDPTGQASRVVRLQPDGGRDPGFNEPTLNGSLSRMVEDAEGRILLVGAFDKINGEVRAGIARLHVDGSLDNGIRPIPFGNTSDVRDTLVLPDQTILVAGLNEETGDRLVWLKPDGSIDRSLSPSSYTAPVEGLLDPAPGINARHLLRSAFDSSIERLLFDDRGRVLGLSWDGVIRLDANGALDRLVPVRIARGEYSNINSAVLASNGNLVVAVGRMRPFVNGFSSAGIFAVRMGSLPRTEAVIVPDRNPVPGSDWPLAGLEAVESAGEVPIKIRRLGDVRQPATVSFTTRDGSAKAGVDYAAVSGTLSFAPFETEKEFKLPLRDNGVFDPPRTLELVLTSATGAESVGPPVTFTIGDREASFVPGGVTANSRNGAVQIEFSAPLDHDYEVQSSSDLRDWTPLGYSWASERQDLRTFWWDYPGATQPARFYRLRRL